MKDSFPRPFSLSTSMGKLRSLFKLRRKSKSPATASGAKSESPPLESMYVDTTAEQMDELERVFRKFDSNGDGKISSSELRVIFESLGQPLAEEELLRMMGEADADGDGFVSLKEFIDLNTKMVDPSTALEDLRQAFSVFDRDRNGVISAEELALVMRDLGEVVSLAQCRKMIDGVDQDGDGLVNFEEFKVMMSKSFLAPDITRID
ncbi:probable calcium-binding protein CML10 [Dendrobium catenatum]|uniref:Putative calcium-binding protein CML10 n=1 Tax=Dendrobium catenatum TaxID=906689 RepID=A0A2I0WL76_9ASPA|nr:probable calcium-binding protein CML10 [Dendrobium catenatum]PKU76413.1 putative calcium-binding protein CML10 [Dendrobium catenatum]